MCIRDSLWIITRRRKTNTESNIRLLDVPKRIIEKYKELSKDVHVFPVPSNGRCNTILKELGRQCGFKIRLTYHVARYRKYMTVLGQFLILLYDALGHVQQADVGLGV